MRIRRVVLVGGLVAAFTVGTAMPAFAEALDDYLSDAGEAIYSGRRLVGTTWDGVESVGIVEIQHHLGTTTVESGSRYATVGAGRMHLSGPSEAAISFIGGSRPDLRLRYTVASRGKTEHLGRSARVVEIMEAGVLRMMMVLDDSTSAPVATRVYSDDGTVFRYSSMVEFSVSVDPAMTAPTEYEYETMIPVESAGLPADAAGYRLIDAYAGSEGMYQAFYSDGLFSFSLFTADGRTDWAASLEGERQYSVAGHRYLTVVHPASLWVMWNAPRTTIALVGDLPPDHLEAVLADLPRPGTPNWLERMWIRLFG